MKIADSSVWLEYFADTTLAQSLEPIISETSELLVPSVTIYEVFRKTLIERTEHEAMTIISYMKKGKIIPLDDILALNAAYYGVKFKLPFADSVIYTVALNYNATLYTLDKHFQGLEHVEYFAK
ncbi:MAG: type II toxin-antitoxin system VapC family toxin [Candidatus Kapabacteria bacterium]|nr:type II toxin-antitoxin system VapC family toxin [Candidatus Kapabacteria bacterium]